MWCQDQYTHSGWGNEHISAAGTDDPMERFYAVSHAVVKPWRVTTDGHTPTQHEHGISSPLLEQFALLAFHLPNYISERITTSNNLQFQRR